LSSTYPYAGGAQVYAARGLGDPAGFVAGWALLLSYTVDIALFSMASAGYLSYFFPQIASFSHRVLGVELNGFAACSIVMILALIGLNVLGIRESSRLNEIMVSLGLAVQGALLLIGLAYMRADTLRENLREVGYPGVREEVAYLPGIGVREQNFIYGTTLAMSSFIGVESIAQAAEEIKRPYKWIPLATKLSVVAVLVFALGLSLVGVGTVGWRPLAENAERPLTVLAESLPVIRGVAPALVAATGFVINLVSANTGIIGVSRVVYSMGRFQLMPSWFKAIHPRFRTPIRTIVLFGLLGGLLTLLGSLEKIADVYAFGALASYVLVNVSMIRLREIDRDAYRPWKAPGSIEVGGREIPLVGLMGALATGIMFVLVAAPHPVGRLLGTAWFVVGLAVFAAYRTAVGLPITGRISGEMSRPANYLMDALVLFRPYDDPEKVARAVAEGLRGRFRVHLLSVVNPAGMSPDELSDEAGRILTSLEETAKRLRSRGFLVTTSVMYGEPVEVAVMEGSSDRYDLVVVLTSRRALKSKERGLARVVSARLPGKVLVLRR
ncbi:MAG: APC family permease, partial [Candidatus Korarchaeota archaeon]|nr:APC family permease [Candidatus Korarchaeota archaeon]